jgi:hypothetical protein
MRQTKAIKSQNRPVENSFPHGKLYIVTDSNRRARVYHRENSLQQARFVATTDYIQRERIKIFF